MARYRCPSSTTSIVDTPPSQAPASQPSRRRNRFRCPSPTASILDGPTHEDPVARSHPRRNVFRCPSSSVAVLGTPLRREAQAPPVPPVSRLSNIPMRSQRDKRKVMANESFRLAMKKRGCHYVYVGSIPPTTTDAMLRHHFKPCGTIQNITIRCSTGVPLREAYVAPNGGANIPTGSFYATVLFKCSRSVSKALKLDGCLLDDKYPLKICLSPGDLPDLELLVQWQIQRLLERSPVSTTTTMPGAMSTLIETVAAQPEAREHIRTPGPSALLHLIAWIVRCAFSLF